VTAVPLRRNRDFLLLQAGQLLSEAGTHSAAIAYPMLVLAVTGSAAQAGVVAFASTLSLTLFALPAGVVADRWNRRRLMIAADGVRVRAVGGLAAAILADRLQSRVIPLVAFVEGAGAALFAAAQAGALRAVVPARQLPGAAGAQTGRLAAVGLVAPTLGGALFGVARALPFLVDAASYAFSTVSLLAMRGPFQEVREPDRSSLRSRLAEGFRFLWATGSCAPARSCSGCRTSSAPASCSRSWSSASARACQAARPACSSRPSGAACCSARSWRRWSAGSSRCGRCCWSCGPGSAAACS
jgi:MFS family permease